jgi:hypothetical protein
VGRLVRELPRGVWREIADRHRVACHGHEHLRIRALGRASFVEDLLAAKCCLEDVSGQRLLSYRAPYFSGEDCDVWFGDALARAGFLLDSSRRIRTTPPAFRGSFPLTGSGGAVREVPFPSLGWGSKRITIIGGSYLRLLPLYWIVRLLERGRARGFIPMVYLHPYDLDRGAAPLDYGRFGYWLPRLGDRIRRVGRGTAAMKFRCLTRIYEFCPIESLFEPDRILTRVDPCEPVHSLGSDSLLGQSIGLGRKDGPGIGAGNSDGTPLNLA